MWYSNFIKTSSEEKDVKYLGKLSDRVKRTGIPPYLANMFGFSTEGPYGDPGVYQSGEVIDKLGGGLAFFTHNPKMSPELSEISTDPYMLMGRVYNQPTVIHETTHTYQPQQTKIFDRKGLNNEFLEKFGFDLNYILNIKENIANFNTFIFYLYNNPNINISYILSMMFAKYKKPQEIFKKIIYVFLVILWQEIKKVYDENKNIKEVVANRDNIIDTTRKIFITQYLTSLLKNIQKYYRLSEAQIADFATRINSLTEEELGLIGENYRNEYFETPIGRGIVDEIMNLEGKRRMMDMDVK